MARLVTVPTLNVNDAISDAYVDSLTGNVNYLSIAGADIAALGANNTLAITASFHRVTLVTGNVDNITDAAGLVKGQPLRLLFTNAQTIRNNGGPGGNIRTLSGFDRAVAANEVVAFLYDSDGAVWREVNPNLTEELAYNEYTSDVTVTATTEATANTVVTASAVTFDGATQAIIEFFTPWADQPATPATLKFWLYDGSSSIGQTGMYASSSANGGTTSLYLPVYLSRRLTPSAASHTYSIRASVTSGTGTVHGGAGGAGVLVPGFIRIRSAKP